MDSRIADDAKFIRVQLLKPVSKGGEARIRIYKTYTDAASYYEKDGGFVFDRPAFVSVVDTSVPGCQLNPNLGKITNQRNSPCNMQMMLKYLTHRNNYETNPRAASHGPL